MGDPRTAEAHLATAAGTECNAGRMAWQHSEKPG
jgi:hypothetical protein